MNSAKDIMDFEDHDKLVKRLKLLSTTQTAFLKMYLHGKLANAKVLVEESLQIIRKNNGRNAQLIALGKEIEDLKIEELNVDEAAVAVAAREEITLLKNAIDGNTGTPEATPVPEANGGADNAAMKAENEKLRQLLKEAQQAIADAKASNSEPAAAPAQDSGASKEALDAAESEAAVLRQTVAEKETALAEMTAKVATLTGELTAANAAVSAAEAQAAAGAGAAGAAAEEKIAAIKQEMEEKLAAAAKEAEEKLEMEKEEMMEAMALEVEEVEKAHREEVEKTEAEKAAQEAKVSALESELSSARQSTGDIAKNLSKVSRDLQALKATQKTIVTGMNADVADLMAGLKGTLSQALSSKLQGMMSEFQDLVGRYRKEVAERKKLHNMVQELKGNIRVYMRARPPSTKELEQFGPDSNCVTFMSDTEVKVLSEKGREKVWEFDKAFDLKTTQEDVYKEVSALVVSAIDGYAVCIFAYGQTGSGKTFTMNGPEDNRGVNTRALDDLFRIAQGRAQEGWEDVITVSVLEVYNEEIHDLLSDEGGKLEIRQSSEGNYVPGLTSVQVNSLDDVDKLMKVAEKHRSQQATNMNEHSSRSHMMLSVTIASHNRLTGFDSKGKLHLVDLAGSERLTKTGAEGKALKEAQNINKSLSALGDVIAARANKQGHVPFRNSTLTYLLQDALSQDSKTLMFVCASPVIYNAEETYCSLNFAARVRTVELGKATKNTGGAKGGRK